MKVCKSSIETCSKRGSVSDIFSIYTLRSPQSEAILACNVTTQRVYGHKRCQSVSLQMIVRIIPCEQFLGHCTISIFSKTQG